jgi:MmyB-like transcription regulator ligand binding domain
VLVPLQLVTDAGTLSLISTTTVFGTPVDVTLSELALECFFPADEETGALLRR